MECRRFSVRAVRNLLLGALLVDQTFAQTARFGTGVFYYGNSSSSSCNNCNVTVPPFLEYYWSPSAYATTTNIAVPAVVNITFYHEGSSIVSQSTLPLGNYSTLLPVSTTKYSTITRTYGPDNTLTTVISYPTPFIDYDTEYSLSGTLSTSSDCLSHTTQATFTPSSHPLYPQLTDISTSSGDQYGTNYVLVSTTLPQTLPGTRSTTVTGNIVRNGSEWITPSAADLHLSILSSTSAFYRSAFSDQAAIGECRPPSSGPTLTATVLSTAAPVIKTSVEFLTTSKSSSLDAGAFAALVARVAAAGSGSQQVSQQGGGNPPPAAQPQQQPQAQPESEGDGSPNGGQDTSGSGNGAPGVNGPSGNQATTTAANGAPTPGSGSGNNQPARPASGNNQENPANTAAPESPAAVNAQGDGGSAGQQNTGPAASGAGSNNAPENPAAGGNQGNEGATNPQETGPAASRVSEAAAGNGNAPESPAAAPFAVIPTSLVETVPVTGPGGVETSSATTVPAAVISGQTLTFGGTASAGGTAFHLTTVSSGGEVATAVVFGTSGGAQSSTVVIPPGSVPVTAGGGGGIGTFICSGVGGCAGQGSTAGSIGTGTATTPVSPEFTGAAASRIGPKRMEVVLIVALLVIVPALGAG